MKAASVLDLFCLHESGVCSGLILFALSTRFLLFFLLLLLFFFFFYERYKEDCSLFKKRISKTCLCLKKKYRNCGLTGIVILINIKETDLHLLTSSAPDL